MLVRTETALTYAGARLALDAALARAAEVGGAFNIAVSDAAGTLLAFARMDGAFAISGGIARDKAWTVAGFGGPSPRATAHHLRSPTTASPPEARRCRA